MSGVHNILRTLNRRAADVVLVGADLTDLQASPTIARVNYRLLATGEEQAQIQAGWVTIGTWLVDGVASDYDFRYAGSGDPPSPNGFDTWVGCETSPENLLEQDGVGLKTNGGLVQIRRKSTGLILASASLSQQVTVDPGGLAGEEDPI